MSTSHESGRTFGSPWAERPTGPLAESAAGLPVEQALLLDEACNTFEAKWRGRGRPDILAALLELPEGMRPVALKELVALDVFYRRKVGEVPTATEYIDRFPELDAVWLEGVVAVVGSPPDAPTIPGYLIVGELGRGGMGVVYRATDSALGRQVAIKVLKPGLTTQSDALARFLREARAVAAVSHDHVVPIYHVGTVDGQPYMILPVLEGESLETRLTRFGSLPPAEVSRIGREAAMGLAAAHERGLVHRDVKPANLWMEAPNGRVRLLDFGLARPSDGSNGLTQSGAVFGTPAYMAPEQANATDVDARADLFGLGAVLYRAATGKPPFEGKTMTGILRAVAEHVPPVPHEVNPAVPRSLSDLIVRMLAKDPTGRPANAGEVAAALKETAVEVRDPARDLESPKSPPRWLRGLVAAILLLVLVTWSLTRGGGESVRDARKKPADDQAAPVIPSTAPRYRGMVDVLVERELEKGAAPQLIRLDDPRALPMRVDDRFRIEGTIDPPAYLYVVWVDPSKKDRPDVTPVYPWNPEAKDGWSTQPVKEEPTGKVSLPPVPTDRYTAVDAKPGVATIVLIARPTPLTVSGSKTRKWFEQLPDLPLPPGGERGAAWFDDYLPVTGDARRPRAFKIVGTDDPFVLWQRQLKTAIDDGAGGVVFQTAISFARTGGK